MLHAGDDPIHDRHRLDRIVARRALGREHHRVGAVIDRGRDVRGLGAGGCGRADHALQHLRRHHHRLAEVAALADDPLLQARHQLRRQLDAEVAARDHHRIGQLDDPVQPLDRGRLLDLGQDRGPARRPACARSAMSSGRCTNDSATQSKPSSMPKLRSARSFSVMAEIGSTALGTLTPLRSDRPPPFDHRGLGEVGAAALDPQPDAAVVEQQVLAGLQHGEDLRVRQVGPAAGRPVPGRGRAGRVAAGQGDPAGREAAHAQLRPLQVHDRADRPAALLLDLAQRWRSAPHGPRGCHG